MKSFYKAMALTGAVSLLVTACSSGTQSNPSASTTNGPVSMELVRVAMPAKELTRDPNKMVDQASLVAMHLAGGTLTDLSDDARSVRPGLAESYRVSADSKTMTFKLRSGLKFSDGSPLTAGDVAASWKYFLGDKANVNSGIVAPVASVSASGTDTVSFSLRSPFPSLSFVVSLPMFSVFKASQVGSGKRSWDLPISAGPFAFSKPLGDGNKVDMVLNPNYWGARPLVKTVEFRAVTDPSTRLVQVQSGQVDVADTLSSQVLPQIAAPVKPEVVPVATGGVYLYMNNRTAPLDNVNVRKAISLAIDRTQISNLVYSGKAKPLLGFFGNNSKFHESSLNDTAQVAQAKAALAGTSCAAGCTVKVMVRSGLESYQKIAQVVQQNLSAVGITLRIEQVDDGVAGQRESDGNFQLEVNNLYDYTDIPDTVLQYGLVSDGGINALFSGYKSAAMDQAARTAITSTGASNAAAIKQVNSIFAQDLPYLPLVDAVFIVATRVDPRVFKLASSNFYEVGRSA